jgi:pyruvate kinase
MISRFKPTAWILAGTADPNVTQGLAFSYGVHPFPMQEEPEDWRGFARSWMHEHQLSGMLAMLVAGPSPRNPHANHRIEFLRVDDNPKAERSV